MSCIECDWIRHQYLRTGDYFCAHPDVSDAVVTGVYGTPDWCPLRNMPAADVNDLWRRIEDLETRVSELEDA